MFRLLGQHGLRSARDQQPLWSRMFSSSAALHQAAAQSASQRASGPTAATAETIPLRTGRPRLVRVLRQSCIDSRRLAWAGSRWLCLQLFREHFEEPMSMNTVSAAVG